MVKKGRFSEVEKAAIRALRYEQKGPKEIAKILGRSLPSIHKFLYDNKKDNKQVIVQCDDTDEKVIFEVKKMLKSAGMITTDIDKLVAGVLKRAATLNVNYNDEQGVKRMYKDCINSMKAGSFMIKKSAGGNDGVAIMTAASSQRLNSKKSTTQLKNTYQPFGKDGKK